MAFQALDTLIEKRFSIQEVSSSATGHNWKGKTQPSDSKDSSIIEREPQTSD
jgi:hypothetical protein